MSTIILIKMLNITKKELEQLYINNPNKEVCRTLNICNATLSTYLKKAGIKLKGKGNRNGKSKIKIY